MGCLDWRHRDLGGDAVVVRADVGCKRDRWGSISGTRLSAPATREVTVQRTERFGLGATLLVALLLATNGGGDYASASQSAPAPPAAGTGTLIVYGDVTLFQPPPHPENCVLRNRFKRGDPVGFRMFVADPSSGRREESATLVVHVSAGGKTFDVPMRYRATATQPERQFWVAKWVVPADAPTGVVRFSVTATDKYGRKGEFKPFEVQASQLTIVD
jgi:hypothetical protein